MDTSPPSEVWLVLGYCGDFYCECEHPVAVAFTEEEAKALAVTAEATEVTYGTGEFARSYKVWPSAVIERVLVGVVATEH